MAVVLAGALLLLLVLPAGAVASATPLSLCSNPGSPPGPVHHVMVVMLENEPYTSVIGPDSKTPYQNGYLASHCGLATEMFAVTHTSAANYLALTGGQYPASSTTGCRTVSGHCASHAASLFSQLDAAGLGWRSYEESMPYACDPDSGGHYKIGHNPALFYSLGDCAQNDLPVANLAATSGPLWAALSAQALPRFSLVTPNLNDDGEGPGGPGAADTWLQAFLGRVQNSPAYQTGDLAIIVAYDEGKGSDFAPGENCTDQSADLRGRQPSCHVAAFVVYPWSSGTDGTFFTLYSITRTVDELSGLPLLVRAGSANTLIGHLGL